MTPPPPPPPPQSATDAVRRQAFREVAALLTQLAEGHERMGNSAMGKLYELAKAEALRDAARRVAELK